MKKEEMEIRKRERERGEERRCEKENEQKWGERKK